tara:strand:+ start:1148 stop:1873 length:726 start_codon:yes stop_codon:yes gene_type:complete
MKSLIFKEVRSYLSSIIGFITIIVFLIITGTFLWIIPGNFNILNLGEASLIPFFKLTPYIYLILIPSFTMKLFAEEKRTGTIELLATKPLSDLQIVIAKFISGFLLSLITLLPTLIYYFTIYLLGEEVGNIDHSSTLGSYIGLILLASSFVSIGMFSSSMVKNQIVAFIVSVVLIYIFYEGLYLFADLVIQPIDYYLSKFSMLEHFKSFERGIIDSRDVVYYLSVTVFFIMLTKVFYVSKK